MEVLHSDKNFDVKFSPNLCLEGPMSSIKAVFENWFVRVRLCGEFSALYISKTNKAEKPNFMHVT